MKKLLGVAAFLEAATGLALIIHPPLVTQLLLGDGVSGAGLALGRVGGFALFALGLACWPGFASAGGNNTAALRALLTYNLLATLYLAYLWIGGEWVDKLLWPAVALHAFLTLFLARVWFGAVGVAQLK